MHYIQLLRFWSPDNVHNGTGALSQTESLLMLSGAPVLVSVQFKSEL